MVAGGGNVGAGVPILEVVAGARDSGAATTGVIGTLNGIPGV